MGKVNDELRINPPKLEVIDTPRQIKIDLVASMCDNKYRWICSKDDRGDWKINTMGYCFSNFGIKYRKDDIEWEMDDGNWDEVWKMINSGYQLVSNIKYR